jgi:hypothetical protein
MSSFVVAVVVWDGVVSDADARDGTEALQTQIDAHFAEAWRVSAQVEVISHTAHLPRAWGVIVGRRSSLAERGYRELTVSGRPLTIVEPVPGRDWTLPASRQLLQMLANPYADLAAYDQAPPDTRELVPIQVCAPVDGDEDAYPVQVRSGREWLVGNFVFPTWFQRGPQPAPFDHLGHAGAPLELGEHGGHAWVLDVPSGRWTLRRREPGRAEAARVPLAAAAPFALDRVRLTSSQELANVHLPP